jgi:hypothetical protein
LKEATVALPASERIGTPVHDAVTLLLFLQEPMPNLMTLQPLA